MHSIHSVLQASVVARPDEQWGETPCAFIELVRNSNLTTNKVIELCRESLASFKLPKTIVFQELPRTSTGKIKKYVLRDLARKI